MKIDKSMEKYLVEKIFAAIDRYCEKFGDSFVKSWKTTDYNVEINFAKIKNASEYGPTVVATVKFNHEVVCYCYMHGDGMQWCGNMHAKKMH